MWPAKVVVREANRKRHKAANVTSVVFSRDPNASNCCNSELKCGILSLKTFFMGNTLVFTVFAFVVLYVIVFVFLSASTPIEEL